MLIERMTGNSVVIALKHYPFVPTVMQNVPLKIPFFWRAGILENAYYN